MEVGVSERDDADRGGRDAEARTARSRYERLVDSALEGIWEVDTEGCTVFANRRMAEILGCEVADMIGRSMSDFLDPDRAAVVEAQFPTIREGRTDRFLARCRRLDGDPVWLMTSAVPLFDEAGEWTGAAATAVDITERRRQEEAFREAEALLRRTFDGAPIGAALVGLDGRWIKVNDAACRMLGRTAEELLEVSFQDITHPDDLDADLELLERTLSGDQSGYSMEKRYLRPGGEIVWATLTVALVRDEKDVPLFFVSQFVDITARKRAEGERDRARERVRRILERAAVAMAVLEADGHLVETNPRFRELLPSATSRATLASSLDESSRPAFRQLLDGGDDGSNDADLVLGDGSGRVLNLVSFREDDGSTILQVSDVTAERRERRRLSEEAMRDPLTGLANRRGLGEAVGRMDPESLLAVVFVDLDGFKALNDREGHNRGDQVLVEVARRLVASVRDIDLVVRVGGDEFVVVLPGGDEWLTRRVADRLVAEIRQIPIGEGLVTASAGLACGTAREMNQLFVQADRAMLEAKAAGKDHVVVAS
jgi:diguanylate cyclase (GGDEF)-like protein/PAS domain S-box-containing protein